MRQLLALVAVVAAATAGAARADVFEVLPSAPAPAVPAPAVPAPAVPAVTAAPAGVTVAGLPNPAGAVTALPFSGVAVQLDYPQLVALWQRAGAAYGIPWQVLGAINKVESNFGRNMGPSSAGAIGWMQFMPSTWARWGVDANQDGVADPWNPEDAVFAAARYLAASGGRTDIARAVFAYNHAQWYVDEVLNLARVMGDIGVDATFTLDKLGLRVAEARKRVAQANEQLLAAERTDRRLAAVESRLVARSTSAPLLSDQLSLQRLAALAGVRHDGAAAVAARLRDRLDQARTELQQARTRAASASFAPGVAPLTGAPMVQGRYVFPVGGGPAAVSVGHTHHDYPAADIAAPEESPVYALTNGTVLRAWRLPDATCGIGFTLLTWDGRSWTYCHLSYLEPEVVQGASLSGGQPAGLVGHTGDATGPHLHLQLQPATTYPQQMPWFQSFAGAAFRWQDAATPASGPLFAVVPADPGADGVVTFSAPQ